MKTTFCSILIFMATGVLSLTALGQAPNTGTATSPTLETAGATPTEVSPSARASLESLFKGLDKNADGMVSREEFLNGSAALAQWMQSHGKAGAKVSAAMPETTARDTTGPAPTGTTGSGGRGGAAGSQPAGSPGTR